MPRSPELSGSGIPPPTERKSRIKEAPQFNFLERICRGVEVVEMEGGERKYHVIWERDDLPVHTWHNTLQQVLNQHERVMERYLGTEIPLAAGKLLRIAGENQKMGELGTRLSNLSGRYLVPLRPPEPSVLKEEIFAIQAKLGQVTNEFKQKAKENLSLAMISPERTRQANGVLEANLAILERNRECLLIVQGTLARFRIVSYRRDVWEQTIENSFQELAQALDSLGRGNLTPKTKEQMARHISGARYGIFVRLNGIVGPEYWARIQTRGIQNLARFGDFLRQGNDQRAQRILQQAILKLERVVKEKQEREKLSLGK